MWSRNYPINIIVSPQSWYFPHAENLIETLKEFNFNVKLFTRHEDVELNAIAFYLSYQRLVPKSYLEKAHVSLVIHASDLPAGKGFSPWVWEIIAGANALTVSLLEIVEELDAGPIIKKEKITLIGTELLEDLRSCLANTKCELIKWYLLQPHQSEGIAQNGEETFYRKRSLADSELDINKTINEQFGLLRVVDNNNYPAFFYKEGQKYILTIRKSND